MLGRRRSELLDEGGEGGEDGGGHHWGGQEGRRGGGRGGEDRRPWVAVDVVVADVDVVGVVVLLALVLLVIAAVVLRHPPHGRGRRHGGRPGEQQQEIGGVVLLNQPVQLLVQVIRGVLGGPPLVGFGMLLHVVNPDKGLVTAGVGAAVLLVAAVHAVVPPQVLKPPEHPAARGARDLRGMRWQLDKPQGLRVELEEALGRLDGQPGDRFSDDSLDFGRGDPQEGQELLSGGRGRELLWREIFQLAEGADVELGDGF